MRFMDRNVIASDASLIIPNESLYHFGVLISNVNMAQIRAISGRLKIDYRYLKDISYSNFIWSNPTSCQKEYIEKAIGCTKSKKTNLYDPNTMSPKIVKVYKKLDKAVEQTYGKKGFGTQAEFVSNFMKMYKEITGLEKN